MLVNLGTRAFRYQEANQRHSQETLQSLSMEEIRSNFEQLPFYECSEQEELEYTSDERRGITSDSEGESKCQENLR